MTNRSNECVKFTDCRDLEGAQICYESAPFSDDVFFCDCSTWYGWTGDKCDQGSGQLAYFRFSLFMFIFTTTAIMAWGVYELFKLWLLPKSEQRFTLFSIALCAILGSLCVWLNAIIQIPSLFDPTRFIVVVYGNGGDDAEDVTVPGGKAAANLLTMGNVFYFLASLTIAISWLHIVEKIPFSSVGAKTISNTKKLIYIFEAVFLLLILITFAIDYATLGGVMVFIGCPILALSFYLGKKRFFDELDSMPSSDQLASAKETVKQCFYFNIACLLIAFVFSMLYYALFTGVFDELEIGGFNYILFIRDVGEFDCLVLLTYALYYVNKLESALTKRHKTMLSENSRTNPTTRKPSVETSQQNAESRKASVETAHL